MNVLNLSSGQDTGGQSLRTEHAFRRHTDWTYTSVVQRATFYKVEHPWNRKLLKQTLWPEADVVHLHNNFLGARMFERRVGPKPYVVHMHGTAYRSDPYPVLEEAEKRGAPVLCSTLDLWALAPDRSEWLPAPYDLDWLRTFRDPQPGPFRIAHAPTARKVKNTEAVIGAVQRLKAEGQDVELDIIEGQSWLECLKRKGRADLYIDQLLLGYGCNAIEAWGMGIPVIAGVNPDGVAAILPPQKIPADTIDVMERTWGSLPFYEATEETLYDAIRALMDPAIRDQYAQRGYEHVERWHDERKVVAQLQDIYRRAAGAMEIAA